MMDDTEVAKKIGKIKINGEQMEHAGCWLSMCVPSPVESLMNVVVQTANEDDNTKAGSYHIFRTLNTFV